MSPAGRGAAWLAAVLVSFDYTGLNVALPTLARSFGAGSSMVAGIFHFVPSAIFCMVPRNIFPERVFGSLVTTSAVLKAATGPMANESGWGMATKSKRDAEKATLHLFADEVMPHFR